MEWLLLFVGLLTVSVKGNSFFAPAIFPNLPVVLDEINGDACQEHFQLVKEALKNNTLWAYKIFDSSAKGFVNIFNGNVYSLGSYDECLEAGGPIKTQYCLVDIWLIYNHENVTDPFRYKDDPYDMFQKKINPMDMLRPRRDVAHWAMCIPASCKRADLQASLQKYVNGTHGDLYEIHIDPDRCSMREEYRITWADILFCIAVVGMLIFGVSCSIFHQYVTSYYVDTNGNVTKLLLCFSFQTSFNDLKRIDKSNRLLDCFNFLRVIQMFTIIGLHNRAVALSGPVFNSVNHTPLDLPSFTISNADFLLDVFLFVGGFLATYNIIKMSKKRDVSAVKLLIARYFRLIPVFILMSFFYATVFEKMGSGPFWKNAVVDEAAFCKENWWTNLLVVNNYVNVSHTCMLQGWYIPTDFHMYIVVVLLNMIYIRNKKLGTIFIIGTLILTLVTSMYFPYITDHQMYLISPQTGFLQFRYSDKFSTVHIPTHVRGSSYIIGLICAHIFIKLQNENCKLSKKYAYTLLCIGSFFALSTTFASLPFYDSTHKHSLLEEGAFTTLSKPVFTVGIALILLSISLGNIIIFTEIVHWRIWTHLSKLTYGMFMTHLAFQLARLGHSRTAYDFETQVTLFSYDILIAIFMSFLLFHLFENPINKFTKELLYSNWSCASNNKTQHTPECANQT